MGVSKPFALVIHFAILSLIRANQAYYNSTDYENGTYGALPLQNYISRPDLVSPAFDIRISPSDPSLVAPGYWLLGYQSTNYLAPLIINGTDGSLVWSGGNDISTTNVLIQEYMGQPVLTYYIGPIILPGTGAGAYYLYDTSYDLIKTVQCGGNITANTTDIHEMVITPNNTFLLQTWVPAAADLSTIGGPTDGYTYDCIIQEVDNDENVLFQWNSLDYVPVNETYFEITGNASESAPFDYCHSNSLAKDDDGTYLFSLRGPSALYKVNGTSGEIIWQLNGKSSDFEMGNDTVFWYQHDARWHNDSTVNPRILSVFDNGGAGTEASEASARALYLSVDEEAMTVSFVSAYYATTGSISASQGSNQLLDNGNVAVGWGSQSVFTEFAGDGSILTDIIFTDAPSGMSPADSYRVFKQVWYGNPTTVPDVGFSDGSLFVSWNGATNVTSWAVVSGTDISSLSSSGLIAKNGFESNLTVPSTTLVGAAALDSTGACMAVSALYYAANQSMAMSNVNCSSIASSSS